MEESDYKVRALFNIEVYTPYHKEVVCTVVCNDVQSGRGLKKSVAFVILILLNTDKNF